MKQSSSHTENISERKRLSRNFSKNLFEVKYYFGDGKWMVLNLWEENWFWKCSQNKVLQISCWKFITTYFLRFIYVGMDLINLNVRPQLMLALATKAYSHVGQGRFTFNPDPILTVNSQAYSFFQDIFLKIIFIWKTHKIIFYSIHLEITSPDTRLYKPIEKLFIATLYD